MYTKEEIQAMSENLEKKELNENDETIADIFNTLSEKQKDAVYAIIGEIADGNDEDSEGGF